ncbi:MAG TPA: alpha-L-rhamnosidase C-terminal domain-containing protein, partial [Rhodothermales bacterium]|nr:alpha-L-rhamnosidase C-terminal domain-containing protein [Rhodothermales bacterium]
GLWAKASWLASDTTWRVIQAPEILPHETQILGVDGTPRIRYVQAMDGRRMPEGLHAPGLSTRGWARPFVITDGPWPATPADVETPPQREYPVRPGSVLAAGRLERSFSEDPATFGLHIRDAQYRPDSALTHRAAALVAGGTLTLEGQAGESRYVTVDFLRPVHGYPFLRLSEATPGVAVDLGYTEIPRSQYDGRMMVNPATGWIDPTRVVGERYADRYVTRAGLQAMELPEERTARWMTLHVQFREAGRVTIEDAGLIKSQYPVDRVGSFDVGDPRIAQLVELGLIHAEVSMTDAYVDTPGREDGQWYEDARLRAVISARWFGDTRLRRFMIRTIAESQQADGRFHDFPPTNFWFISSHDWNVQWTNILHDEYVWSGDRALVRTYWRPLTRYWQYVLSHVDAQGVWRTHEVRADIRVGVITEQGQSSGIVTPTMLEGLQAAIAMARAIGETAQAAAWQREADRMTQAFRRVHVVPAQGSVPAHVADRFARADSSYARGFSQAGQSIAVYTGLLTPEQARAVLAYALPGPVGTPPAGVTRWNNPTFSDRILRALAHVGMTERAVAHLIERYSQYLPGHPANPIPLALQGPYGGPLPEYMVSREDLGLKPGEINPAQPGDDTGSHGWAAIPLLWLHDTLLGVQIAEPGGARLTIAPQTGGLPYVEGRTVTPKGTVWVKYDPQLWAVDVEIPAGVTAKVVLPSEFEGKRVRPVSSTTGRVRTTATRTYEIAGAGRYRFEAF